jgi:uncharacterized coiled-coil protein SlyX
VAVAERLCTAARKAHVYSEALDAVETILAADRAGHEAESRRCPNCGAVTIAEYTADRAAQSAALRARVEELEQKVIGLQGLDRQNESIMANLNATIAEQAKELDRLRSDARKLRDKCLGEMDHEYRAKITTLESKLAAAGKGATTFTVQEVAEYLTLLVESARRLAKQSPCFDGFIGDAAALRDGAGGEGA